MLPVIAKAIKANETIKYSSPKISCLVRVYIIPIKKNTEAKIKPLVAVSSKNDNNSSAIIKYR